ARRVLIGYRSFVDLEYLGILDDDLRDPVVMRALALRACERRLDRIARLAYGPAFPEEEIGPFAGHQPLRIIIPGQGAPQRESHPAENPGYVPKRSEDAVVRPITGCQEFGGLPAPIPAGIGIHLRFLPGDPVLG